MEYLLLIVGFFLLIKGADFFVDGSSALAKTLKIPSVVIGLTIVAMGTSAPEASVSINASLAGSNAIALSNVIGSNMFNSLVVVGVCAAMKAFVVDKDILKRDMPVNILATGALFMMVLDGVLSRLDGIILLVMMICYMAAMVYSSLKNRIEDDSIESMPLYKSLAFIVVGLIAVIYGGDLVVDNACIIAESLGLSQNFIALTIIAIGTSLPELVTSIVATRKNESGLALGNAVGSNLFNILFILGSSSVVSPLSVLNESIIDCILLVGVALVLYFFAKTKNEMGRKEGLLYIGMYIAFSAYLFIR